MATFKHFQGLPRLLLTFPRKLIIVLEHPCKFTQFSDVLWEEKGGVGGVQTDTWVIYVSLPSKSRQVPRPYSNFQTFEGAMMPEFVDLTHVIVNYTVVYSQIYIGVHYPAPEHGEGCQLSTQIQIHKQYKYKYKYQYKFKL